VKPFPTAAIAGALTCVVTAWLVGVVVTRVFTSCTRFNPCPTGPPCLGISQACHPSSVATALIVLSGALSGVAGGVVAYRRARGVRGT
jgi:hypothetical protein